MAWTLLTSVSDACLLEIYRLKAVKLKHHVSFSKDNPINTIRRLQVALTYRILTTSWH